MRGNSRLIDAGIVVYATAVSTVGSALVARRMFSADVPFARIVAWQGMPYVAWALLVPLIERIVRPRRASIVFLATVPICALHAAFSSWWLTFAHPAGTTRGFFDRFDERFGMAMLIYIAIAALLWLRLETRRRAMVESDLVRAELEILKLQMQPHFLFNTLQSIAVLVKKDPDAAVRVTRDLASLLRVALRRTGQMTTLAAELEIVRHYLDIEQIRFGERLRIAWDIAPDAESCAVPELMLQPIVENAVRHGAMRNAEGGVVTIRARRAAQLVIEVLDDGPGFDADAEDHIGLGATRRRLENLHCTLHIEPREPRGVTVRIGIPQ